MTAQLIHAATEAHLWARDYGRDLTDVLSCKAKLRVRSPRKSAFNSPTRSGHRLASARSVNPQADEAIFSGGIISAKAMEQGWKQAIDYFERAIEFAPEYAAAYAGLSDAWRQRGGFGGADFKEVESPRAPQP